MQNVKVRCSDTVKKNGDINSLRIKIKLLFMGTDSFLFCPHHSCCTWNLLRCCTCSTVSHRQQLLLTPLGPVQSKAAFLVPHRTALTKAHDTEASAYLGKFSFLSSPVSLHLLV